VLNNDVLSSQEAEISSLKKGPRCGCFVCIWGNVRMTGIQWMKS